MSSFVFWVAAAALALDLPTLQDDAVAANPDLEAGRARVAEIAARARVAGAWSDPVVAVELSNAPVDSLSLGDHAMSGIQLRVQQMLQPPGWSARRRAIDGHASVAADRAREDAALQLRAAVAVAWWSLARTRLLRAVTDAHVARTEELLEAVTARYEVGTAGQHAVLRLELLRHRLRDDLTEFDMEARAWRAVLGRALSEPLPSDLELPAALTVAEAPDAVAWRELAGSSRPALADLDARIASEEAGAAFARVDALPDPSVWVGYRVRAAAGADPGTDFVSAGVGVPLPLGSGRRAAGERDARLHAVSRLRAEREALLDAIASEGERTLATWQRGAAKARTYAEVLIPSATAALDTTRAEFTVDRADFASLFDAEVALLDLERALIVASAATHVAEAQAAALVGVPIGGSP